MHPSVYAVDADYQRRRVARNRERRASSSAAVPSLTYQIPSLSKVERRRSLPNSLPHASPQGSNHSRAHNSAHYRQERRLSCSSTASLSDSYSTVSSSCSTKSCTFNEEAEVIHIAAATTLTGESLWYKKEDFDNFRKKTIRIINNVDETGRCKNGKKYCVRGLEKYMARAQESRQNLQKSILVATDDDESPSLPGQMEAPKQGTFRKKIMPWRRKSIE